MKRTAFALLAAGTLGITLTLTIGAAQAQDIKIAHIYSKTGPS